MSNNPSAIFGDEVRIKFKYNLVILLNIFSGFWCCSTTPVQTTNLETKKFSEPSDPSKFVDDQVLKENLDLDSGFADWLNKFANKPSVLDLDQKSFLKFANSRDPITQAYLKLRWKNEHKKAPSEPLILSNDELQEHMKAWTDTDKAVAHPLTPYLLLELTSVRNFPEQTATHAASIISAMAPQSCPARTILKREITSENLKEKQHNDLRAMLLQMSGFKSKRVRLELFERFLKLLPESKRSELIPEIREVAQTAPEIFDKFPWIGPSPEKAGTAFDEFARIQNKARRFDCEGAKRNYLSLLGTLKSQENFEKAFNSANTISSCFRRKGFKAQVQFWEEVSPAFRKSFGFGGWGTASIRMATLLWGRDRYQEARDLLQYVIEEAKKAEQPTVQAKALHVLGQIAENEGNTDQSIALYESYLSAFGNEPQAVAASMSLVLLYSEKKDWAKAQASAQKILQSQNLSAFDNRDIESYTFALFWSGRMHLLMGEKEQAKEMWSELARHYYSTFYGVLGHIMLEKSTGRGLPLAPYSPWSRFNPDNIAAAFDGNEQGTVDRIMSLLELGLDDEATCEIGELQLEPDQNSQILAKAILWHASGRWLDGIKLFHSLPRSYRHILPVGLELLLFPKAYDTQIVKYSRSLKMDPFFVMALIRQESVFNPNARSPADARGLMQMTPGSAKIEARKMLPGYVSEPTRQRVVRDVRNPENLYDPELSLILGVHHIKRMIEKYENPVFALAAYNAGGNALNGWVARIPSSDLLTFIERVPYMETKNYIKLIFRNYFYYSRWYGKDRSSLPFIDLILAPVVENKMATASAKKEVILPTPIPSPPVPLRLPVEPEVEFIKSDWEPTKISIYRDQSRSGL